MSAIASTDTKILDKGGEWNVRSGLWERKIDFRLVDLTANTEYEFLRLPKGFVPRNAAIVNLKSPPGCKVTLTAKSDSSKKVELAPTFGDWTIVLADATGATLAFSSGTWTLTYTPTGGSETTDTITGCTGYETHLAFTTSGAVCDRTLIGTGKYAIASIAGASNDGETMCLKVDVVPKDGFVKVAVSGDWMTAFWNAALNGDAFDPAEHVRINDTDRSDV